MKLSAELIQKVISKIRLFLAPWPELREVLSEWVTFSLDKKRILKQQAKDVAVAFFLDTSTFLSFIIALTFHSYLSAV
jgi:hypothetical protein